MSGMNGRDRKAENPLLIQPWIWRVRVGDEIGNSVGRFMEGQDIDILFRSLPQDFYKENLSMFMQLHNMEILDLSSPINLDDDNLCGNFRGPDLPIVTLPS
jgi:hypothetical protein